MILNGKLFQQFKGALLDAFPRRVDLERMLMFSMNVELDHVATGPNYDAEVFTLIEWAKAQGRTDELLRCAREAVAGNPQLIEFEKIVVSQVAQMGPTSAQILAALQPHRRFDSALHGPPHWARVHRFGMALAERVDLPTEGRACVELFAWLHDLAREDDGPGRKHAVDGAAQIDAILPEIAGPLSPAQVETLRAAIRHHSDGMVAAHAWESGALESIDWPRDLVVATVGCCWDADRLDLPRVGITPAAALMSTSVWREVAPLSARIHRQAAASLVGHSAKRAGSKKR